jgi:hypothetical protein
MEMNGDEKKSLNFKKCSSHYSFKDSSLVRKKQGAGLVRA